MHHLFEHIISIPKSLVFCLNTLPFRQAIHLPIFVRYNTHIKNYGKIVLTIKAGGGRLFNLISIGFGGVGIFDKKYQRTIWDVCGEVVFEGSAFIGHGSRISVGRHGKLALGNDFSSSAMMSIICSNSIIIGDSVLFGWDTQIMDNDFHGIVINGLKKNPVGNIKIGNHVWIGSRVSILKNSVVSDNSVIASGSIVSGIHDHSNCLLAGVPAREKAFNINWSI